MTYLFTLKKITIFLFFVALLSSFGVQAIDNSEPKKFVKTLFDEVIQQLDENREVYKKQPQKLKEYANEKILIHFDSKRMAKFILGREIWSKVTEKQQNDFISALSNLVISSYTNSLLKLEMKKVEVGKPELLHKGRVAKVPMTVYQTGKPEGVELSAQLIKSVEGKWRVYDASVDGISILVSYRKTYSEEIDKKGIDKVTEEMQQKIKKIESGGAVGELGKQS